MISAHRSGVGHDKAAENTLAAIHRASEAGFPYIEFDVQRCADGVYVAFHNSRITVNGVQVPVADLTSTQMAAITGNCCLLDDIIEVLRGRSKAHVDLKFTSPAHLYATPTDTYEVHAAARIVAALGPENVIITTMEDRSVAAVRAWSRHAAPDMLVGLSLGRDDFALNLIKQAKMRTGELFPLRRIQQCDANLIVANYRLARLGLARFAARHQIPLLVWTVDSDTNLMRWLNDHRVWMVTTNFPERALGMQGVTERPQMKTALDPRGASAD